MLSLLFDLLVSMLTFTLFGLSTFRLFWLILAYSRSQNAIESAEINQFFTNQAFPLPELLLLLGTWLEPRTAMYSHCLWSDLSQRHAP